MVEVEAIAESLFTRIMIRSIYILSKSIIDMQVLYEFAVVFVVFFGPTRKRAYCGKT